MDMSAISANVATAVSRTSDSSTFAKDTDSSSTGFKYVTVQQGGYIYTYIVIGKNMKVLLSQAPVEQVQGMEKNTKNDKQADENKVNTVANNSEANQLNLQDNKAAKTVEKQVAKEYKMLTLTAFCEKQMRDTLREMEEKIAKP